MKKILFALLLISFGASAQNKTIYLKVGTIDTSFVGTSYFNKTYITSNLGTKLNITDTAAMLAGYKTFYPRVAISLTTTGSSGAATYNNGTGVLNIPSYAGGTTTNALTMNNGGAGAASGTTFNGSIAQTISYNTIGAQPQLSGTGFVKATGTTISYDNSTYLTTTTAGTTYVPYTGATGAVNLGANTLASGAITSSGNSVFTGTDRVLTLTNTVTSANSLLRFASNGTNNYSIGHNGGNFIIYDDVASAYRLTIAATSGAATFSSSVTASGGVFSNGFTGQTVATVAPVISLPNGSSNATIQIFNSGGTGVNILSISQASGSVVHLNNTGTVILGSYTVSTLPTGTTYTGAICYVTDALAPTYGATVVGGGAVKTLVFYDGTAWKVH